MRYGFWYQESKKGACFTGEGTLEQVVDVLKGSFRSIIFTIPDNEPFDNEGGLDYSCDFTHQLLEAADLLTE